MISPGGNFDLDINPGNRLIKIAKMKRRIMGIIVSRVICLWRQCSPPFLYVLEQMLSIFSHLEKIITWLSDIISKCPYNFSDFIINIVSVKSEKNQRAP